MSTRILAVDTTAEFGSVALVADGALVSEILIHSPEGFGGILYGRLENLLRGAGWKLDHIDCFAAAAGPGSFTGVRIGLAAVKGLAEATGKPAIAVSNLAALAWFGTAPLRAAVLDARRGQIYGAVYDENLAEVSPEIVTGFPTWLETLPAGDLEFVATAFAPFRPALAGTRFENVPVREAPRAQACAVGSIAAIRYRSGLAQDPAALDANYVRRSDAELFWKE